MGSRNIARLVGACVGVLWFSTSALAYRTHLDAGLVQAESPPTWLRQATFALDVTAFDAAERIGVQRAVRRALSTWTTVSCAAFDADLETSRATAVVGDGVSQIVWVEDWAERGFDSDSLAVTETLYSTRGEFAEIIEADVYLNLLGTRWASGTAASADVRSIESVLTHEFGHSLGLAHSCGAPFAPRCDERGIDETVLGETTMSPLYRHSQSVLSADDEAGICSLYPRDMQCESDTQCRPLEACVENQCVDSCASLECMDGATCVDGACESSCVSCGSCESDVECPDTMFCRGSRCVNGFGRGEPCSRDEQCGTTRCLSGTCGPQLCADASCDGRYGDPCNVGAECDSSLCVRRSAGASFCSRSCDERNVCPPSYQCEAVNAVCVPSASGCAVSWHSGPTPLWGFALLFSVFGYRRTRPKRGKK